MRNHLKDIVAGTITKTNIIGLRKAFNAYSRNARGYGNGRTSPTLTFDERQELEAAIAEHRPIAGPDLEESGKILLKGARYAKRWTPEQQAIVSTLSHFRLERFENYTETDHVPVYRAIAKDGRSFLFRNIPWQSGGNGPEVLPC